MDLFFIAVLQSIHGKLYLGKHRLKTLALALKENIKEQKKCPSVQNIFSEIYKTKNWYLFVRLIFEIPLIYVLIKHGTQSHKNI